MWFIYTLLSTVIAQTNIYIPPEKVPPSPRAFVSLNYYPSINTLLTFGGYSGKDYFSEIWQYNLDTNFWSLLSPGSEFFPFSRAEYGSFKSALLIDKLYIFGGRTSTGLKNDLWEFTLETLSWKSLEATNPPSIRRAFAYTSYVEDGHEYFAIFGGESMTGKLNDLHVLNMTTFQWEERDLGIKNITTMSFSTMVYYNKCFFLVNGLGSLKYNLILHRFCNDANYWVLELSNAMWGRGFISGIVYNEYLYLFSGGYKEFSEYIVRVNLKNSAFSFEELVSFNKISIIYFGLVANGNLAYIFGGYSEKNNMFTNELFSINLDNGLFTTISPRFETPEKRLQASMLVINGELYLFGGRNQDTLYNNMWIFNVESEIWRLETMTGDLPTPRYSFASDVDGNALIVFAGEDASGLKNDIFIYNSLNSVWKKLIPKTSTAPRPNKGSCLVFKFPLVYIYGGTTDSGVSNELWLFDIGSLEFKKISESSSRSYAKCNIYADIFYILEGNDESDRSAYGYLTYNLTSKIWQYFNYDNYYRYSLGIQIMLNDTYVSIGGQNFLADTSNFFAVFYPNNKLCVTYSLIDGIYLSAYAYYKNYIYSYGGGYFQGSTAVFLFGTYDFYYLKMEEICQGCSCDAMCSKGTYKSNNGCLPCEKGHYSEIMGSTSCYPCPPGTYNPKKGGSSYRQCYPCPAGTFNSKYGSAKCYDCPSALDCPVGSKQTTKLHHSNEYTSVQPKMYTPHYNNIANYYIAGIIVFFFLIIAGILSLKKLRNNLKILDIFSNMHNHDLMVPMVMKKTNLGGFFTVIFVAATMVYFGTTIIEYYYNNVQETKALVPLIVLENDVDTFKTERFLVTCTLVGYNGECGVNKVCNSQIFINITGFASSSFEYECEIIDKISCRVSVLCNDCVQIERGSVFINFREKLSYASAIYVNVTSNSSIPNELSSIQNELYASEKYVMIGSEASEFYYTTTPSLFVSESSKWPSQLTGYHVSSEQYPSKGSECLGVDLSVSAELKVMIYLYKSNSGLYTQRLFRQSVLLLISSVIGSVFGIMSGIASFMSFMEDQYLTLTKARIRKKKFRDITFQRQEIDSSYFGIRKKSSKRFGSRVLPLNDEMTILHK
ncbi:hypothetical protein SteCoe_27918 [Stentor coeruleus]|uniref:Tyrosine-protein kinase ephrin type A/B receptor-like domain-containing protein n=1 Tax=Stentor coeruleus TaxID=5963 RepID=A0A1R2B9G5_9CILI|nr:hypothetical protein SteCoe_27918 [Stentor coeruleus]